MEDNQKIIVKGIDTANCNFEVSKVSDNTIELLNPEDYPTEQRTLISEINKKLQAANQKCHMAQLREEMFAKGFDAGMYIVTFDENEHMVSFEFTDGTRKMLGYDGLEDLPNEFNSWVKTLVPEQKDTIVKLFWDSVKMHRQLPEISHAEYQMRKKDGSLIWITGAGRFVRRSDGSLEVYMGCYREVTAEHEKEEHLRIIEGVGKLFNFCLYINVADSTYKIVRTNEFVEALEKKPDAFEFLRDNVAYGVGESYKDELSQWLQKENILRLLTKHSTTVKDFYSSIAGGWFRGIFIVGDRKEDGNPSHIIYGCEDITASKLIELAQKEQIEQQMAETMEYSRIMSSTGFGIWHIFLKDGTAPRMRVNDKTAELLGITGKNLTEEEIYNFWYENIVSDAIPSVQEGVGVMLSGHFSENTYQWVHPTKGIIYVRCGGTAKKLEDGTDVLSGYYGDVTDIILEEQHKKDELKELNKRILIDTLTGANNRNAVDKYLSNYIIGKKSNYSIAMIDVDSFKGINDTYGHASGDHALQLLTKAFMKNLTEHTFFARYGGDEFIMVSTSEDPEDISKVVEHTRISLKEMCQREQIGFDMDFSCGIVQKSPKMKTVSDILAVADAEMYKIKKEKHISR